MKHAAAIILCKGGASGAEHAQRINSLQDVLTGPEQSTLAHEIWAVTLTEKTARWSGELELES